MDASLDFQPIQPKMAGAEITDFAKLINYSSFVDQTLLINQIFTGTAHHLVTVPKMWGKTTAISMLKHFLAIEIDEAGVPTSQAVISDEPVRDTGNYKLFTMHNLTITEDLTIMDSHFGKYPVICIDFIHSEVVTEENMPLFCRQIVRAAYLQHCYLMKSTNLSIADRKTVEFWCQNVNLIAPTGMDIGESLAELTRMLHLHFSRPCFILIDNYDLPMAHALSNTTQKELIAEMFQSVISILSGMLNNQHVCHTFITGIEYITEFNLSAVNDLTHHEFLKSGSICQHYGFTTDDVTAIFRDFGVPTDVALCALSYYAGNMTEDGVKLYNFWSITKFLAEQQIRNFWSICTQPFVLHRVFEVPHKEIMKLLCGQPVICQLINIAEANRLYNLARVNSQDVCDNSVQHLYFPLLIERGYLSLEEKIADATWIVKIPNVDVMHKFTECLRIYARNIVNFEEDLRQNCSESFYAATLARKDCEAFNERMNEVLNCFGNLVCQMSNYMLDCDGVLNEFAFETILATTFLLESPKFNLQIRIFDDAESNAVIYVVVNDCALIVKRLSTENWPQRSSILLTDESDEIFRQIPAWSTIEKCCYVFVNTEVIETTGIQLQVSIDHVLIDRKILVDFEPENEASFVEQQAMITSDDGGSPILGNIGMFSSLADYPSRPQRNPSTTNSSEGNKRCKKAAVGVEDFIHLITYDSYVDKTSLIEDIFSGPKNKLVTAPKRCGKSTIISMLKYFSGIEVDQTSGVPISQFITSPNPVRDTKNYKIFTNRHLKITENTEMMDQHFGKYPVLHLDFNPSKTITGNKYVILFWSSAIQDAYKEHQYLLASDKLSPEDKKNIQLWLDDKAHFNFLGNEIVQGVIQLAKYLFLHFNRQCYVLVDNFDALTIQVVSTMIVSNATAILQSQEFMTLLISRLMQCNDYIDRIFITGISCGSGIKLPVHVGYYNFLKAHSISQLYGLTAKEVTMLFQRFKVPKKLGKLARAYYLGWKIEDGTKMYNFWSIASFLMVQKVETFWNESIAGLFLNSSTCNNLEIPHDQILKLMRKQSIKVDFTNQSQALEVIISWLLGHGKFDECCVQDCYFLFLIEEGFLTLDSRINDTTWTVKIPNEEVRSEFFRTLRANTAAIPNFEMIIRECCMLLHNTALNSNISAVRTNNLTFLSRNLKSFFFKMYFSLPLSMLPAEYSLRSMLATLFLLAPTEFAVDVIMLDNDEDFWNTPICVLVKNCVFVMKFDMEVSAERVWEIMHELDVRRYDKIIRRRWKHVKKYFLILMSLDFDEKNEKPEELSMVYVVKNIVSNKEILEDGLRIYLNDN